jgi:hypothetical protein
MPTGFTSIIEDNPDTTFRAFALRCARGMGACANQSDESLDVPPKVEESNLESFYAVNKQEREKHLAKLQSMTASERHAMFDGAVAQCEKFNADSIARSREMQRRYESMRQQVLAWTPPTPEHERFQCFMLEQIDSSVEALPKGELEIPRAFYDWWRKEIHYATESTARAVENFNQWETRTRERKEWIEQLYASLESP